MEKTKVISVRMPESVIKELDQAVSKHQYWKRNAVISQAVMAFLKAADVHTQYAILHWWWHDGRKAKLDFREKDLSDPLPDFEAGV